MTPILASESFVWLSWLYEGITPYNIHVFHGLIVLLVITIFGLIYRSSIRSIDEESIPDHKVSVKNIFQTSTEGILNLMKGVIPHHTEEYLPLLGSVFIYIFISNLMGVFPGFLPPTENVNTNAAAALTVFVYYHYIGIKRQGFKKYMSHFFGPDLGKGLGMFLMRFCFLAPLMFVIEIISHCVRPISLSLRLFGNINGDHLVLSIFSEMTPWVIPVVFLCFGIFVAFIQAFVFTLLSTIYVGLAVETHEHSC